MNLVTAQGRSLRIVSFPSGNDPNPDRANKRCRPAFGGTAANRHSIGRVGLLAMMLGVGIALVSIPATASAEAGDDSSIRPPVHQSGQSHQSESKSGPKASGMTNKASEAANSIRSSHTARPSNRETAPNADPGNRPARSPQFKAPSDEQVASVEPTASDDTHVEVDASIDPFQVDPQVQQTPVNVQRIVSATPSAGLSPQSTPIATDPSMAWVDGIFRGTLGATSSEGMPLKYTIVSAPSLGGKLYIPPQETSQANPNGSFSYLPDQSALADSTLNEKFSIMVSETTTFDTFLIQIPIIGLFVPSLLDRLYQTPVLNQLLAPIIGNSTVVNFSENPYSLAENRPTAFTYKMPSFDGTPISVNYFPALSVARGEALEAPTVLNGPGLGASGAIDPDGLWNFDPHGLWGDLGGLVPGIGPLRTGFTPGYSSETGGYNVVTWDPRGEYDSGGILQLDNPFWEGRDTSSIISWLASESNVARRQIKMEASDDPIIGMVGGSYGGGIQMTLASTPDKRVDAIVPAITWNNLNESLYPNEVFKTGWADLLGLALISAGARVNSQIWDGILIGNLLGWMSPASTALLADSGSSILINNIDIPTLIIQGTVDGLFPLQQAVESAAQIASAHPLTPLKMSFGCFGHGVCSDPQPTSQDQNAYNLMWLDEYIGGIRNAADSIPTFQWWDQKGEYHNSELMPFDPAFNAPTPLRYTGKGGDLALVPVLGGSGPDTSVIVPANVVVPTKAVNALNVPIDLPQGTIIMGQPNLTFTYTGLGLSHAVYAQLVDDTTNRVVGNITTAIPVTLDGREHTVQLPMEWIAYTAGPEDSLTLQITSSATQYEQAWAYGLINIDNISLDIPRHSGT